jgi:16S rRNA processing protein RimM
VGEISSDPMIIGKIVGCFGIKGWVKIHAYTDPVENFLVYGTCTVKARDGRPGVHDNALLEFDSGRRQGKGLVAHIKGVDDRTLAESYKGLELTVAATELPQLGSGDFYWQQLSGLKVWCADQDSEQGAGPESDQRVLLGMVDHLIETGANDVMVVKACEGSYDQKERLVPYLPGDVVTRVDLEEAVIEVDWFLEL